MKNKIKEFFQITESKYVFNIFDITALFTVLNVILILAGFWWAPIFGLINCGIILYTQIKNGAYINAYITQLALIVLNVYFLTL